MRMKKLSLPFFKVSETRHQSTPTHTVNIYHARYNSGVEVAKAVAYPYTPRKSDRLPMARDLITQEGFSQKEAAEALDMSQSYISRLLNKK